LSTLRHAVLAAALVLAVGACGRDEIISVDSEAAPGQTSRTREALLTPDRLDVWVDMLYSGFARPSSATYVQIEEGTPNLISRALFRFGIVQDSVFLTDTVSGALRFDSVRVVAGMDTLRTVLSSTGTTLRLIAVGQQWDARSANWDFAVDTSGSQIAWSAGPGGTFGEVLAEATLTELADSVIFDLGARGDSLVRSWADTTQENTGLALAVSDSGRAILTAPRVQYRLVPEVEPDTSILLRAFANARTFIFDRSVLPNPQGVLRVGGVDGWRVFAELIVPDSVPVEGSTTRFRFRGATINKAELIFVSLEPPVAPFAAEADFTATVFDLADDFRVYGAKTPVGNAVLGSEFTFRVDSLAEGSVLRFNITRRIQTWARIASDSTPGPIRLMIRSLIEGGTFGFWEFGAVDGDVQFAPVLRIVFTPPIEFTVP
jgi:hypothetical protein